MSEKKETETKVNVQDVANILASLLTQKIQQAKTSDWQLATQPFKKPLTQEEKWQKNIISPQTTIEHGKKIEPFKTYTFLDEMFLDENDKPIDGIPFGANAILTGLPNSGKSLLIEEIALQTASRGKKVCLVSSEELFRSDTPRYDLESRLMERAKSLKLNWEEIKKNLFVLDVVAYAELRDFHNFVSTYRYLAEKEKIDLLLLDSLTMLEDSRGQIKYRLIELCKYNQIHGITAIMVSQRATDSSDSLSLAGGIGLTHIADIVLELDYKKISSWDSTIKADIECKNGEIVYFFRILKDRMTRFKGNYFRYEITKDGLVRLVK